MWLTLEKGAEVLGLAPLVTSGPGTGAPSISQFVMGALDAARFAQAHCSTRAGWIAFLREAVALRARLRGKLSAGKMIDASPLSLTERARLDPLTTAAEMRDAWAAAPTTRGAADELGVEAAEWMAALRFLPDLAAEFRAPAAAPS